MKKVRNQRNKFAKQNKAIFPCFLSLTFLPSTSPLLLLLLLITLIMDLLRHDPTVGEPTSISPHVFIGSYHSFLSFIFILFFDIVCFIIYDINRYKDASTIETLKNGNIKRIINLAHPLCSSHYEDSFQYHNFGHVFLNIM